MNPARMARLHAAAFSLSRPWSEKEFAALLDGRGTFAIGDDAAFSLIRVVADEAELLTIATHPDHRRQGLGLALMAQWHAKAAKRGAAQAFLEVAEDNDPALRLYERCGYRVAGRRKAYYPRPGKPAADALLMTRIL